MTYGKMKLSVLAGLVLLSVCCLSGCSFSFCGFPVGGREELVFACEEEPVRRTSDSGTGSGAPGEADRSGGSGAAAESDSSEDGEAAESGITSDGRVNINSANMEELMTLSGVGESRAKAIMEYREQNGPFQDIEDIMQIPGIKEGIFSKIKEQIAVD